jgi:mersacidin/lichenicidin family type 2 lantibiotic
VKLADGTLQPLPKPFLKGKSMSNQTIIRAWKDEDFRLSLSESELALLPHHPAGSVELTDQMGGVAGTQGFSSIWPPLVCSAYCCRHISIQQ